MFNRLCIESLTELKQHDIAPVECYESWNETIVGQQGAVGVQSIQQVAPPLWHIVTCSKHIA